MALRAPEQLLRVQQSQCVRGLFQLMHPSLCSPQHRGLGTPWGHGGPAASQLEQPRATCAWSSTVRFKEWYAA